MEFNFGNIFKDLKRSIRISNFLPLLVIIVCGFIIFAPDELNKVLYLNYIEDKYKWIFGLLFLISSVIIILKILQTIYYSIINFFQK